MLRNIFNENWIFSKDEATMMNAGSGKATTVNLPHDAMIFEERSESNPSANAGGWYPGGNYVYTKTFEIPQDYEGKSVFLEFEGVYEKARIYVNGDFAGSCINGYRNFYIKIDPFLYFGKENTVQVKVTNGTAPNSRWYTGSGIYRPVNLLVGDIVHVPADGVKITTPDAAEDVSVVETEISLEYNGIKTDKVYVETEIIDVEGNVVASERTPVTMYAKKSPAVFQRIYIRDARLWSIENPNLYNCLVKIKKDESVLDETVCTFGIRRIQLDPVYGLRINGEKVLLRGACIHHDNGVIGAATFAKAEERRVRMLKEAGFNALRIAHNSSSKALLSACDKEGMLVMDESFDMWTNSKNPYDYALHFADEWEKDLEAIVAKDFNHPCVIMYCIGNEIQELGTAAGAARNRELANKFRMLDATRFVTNAVNGLMTIMDNIIPVMADLGILNQENMLEAGEQPAGDVNDMMTLLIQHMDYLVTHHSVGEKLEETLSALDICGYNYMNARFAADAAEHPNRILCGAETYPPSIDLNWSGVKSNAQVIGDFTWTGWDYIGEAGVGMVDYNETTGFFKPFPAYLAYCGDMDIIGHRRPMSFYREIVWGLRQTPFIAVQLPEHYEDTPMCTPWAETETISGWTWPGFEGKPVVLEVYSGAEEVELFLNDISLGKQPTGEATRFKAIFDTIYQPGIIEAVAYTAGKECGRYKLHTAKNEVELKVEIEDRELAADGEDLGYVRISLVDSHGTLNTSADRKVKITLNGVGNLQGFGSANPRSNENFYDCECTTFYGKALAVVRAGNVAGEIAVTVEAKGCDKVVKVMNVVD